MRKIASIQDIEKRKKRNNFLLGSFLVLLLILSTLGYAILDNQNVTSIETVEYGNLKFERTSQYWATTISGQIVYFNYLPDEVKNVSIEGNYQLSDYVSETIYFVNANPAINQIINSLQNIATRVQEACLEGTQCEVESAPVKNCTDRLFVYVPGQEKVYKNQNCIYLSGDVYRTTDRLLYEFYGIL